MQTTQANAELFANTDTEFSAETVDTHPTDTQHPVEPQEVQLINFNRNKIFLSDISFQIGSDRTLIGLQAIYVTFPHIK